MNRRWGEPEEDAARRSPLRKRMIRVDEPILITVSDEGLLSVIDARSGAVAEVFDKAAGRGVDVQGLCFIGPKEFGVFSSTGTITFCSLTPLAYQQALCFIDNMT